MVKRDITHLKSEPVAEPSSTEEPPPKWAGMKYDPSTGEFERPSAPQTSAEQCNQSDRAWPCPKCGLRNNSACDHKYHTKSTPQPVSVDAPPNEDPWGKVFSEEIRDSKDPIVRLADSIVYGFAIVTPHTKDNLGVFSNETYVKEVRSVVEKLRRYFPPASQTPLGLFVSARLKKLNQSHLGFDQICELISDLLATPASTINCPIHGTHSPANTNRCICSPKLPEGVLEFHVRIKKEELEKFIPVEENDFKPGEGYTKALESVLEKVGIKSVLVMRVYDNKEG